MPEEIDGDFDLQALYDALDEQRRARKLSWAAVAIAVSSDAGQILRWDTHALFTALDEQRRERQLTWTEVAREVRGVTPSMLTSLSKGGCTAFPHVMRLVGWLDQPAAAFTCVADW